MDTRQNSVRHQNRSAGILARFQQNSKGDEVNREQLAALYLAWRNDYLTIAAFAEHHGLYDQEAADLLNVARRCYENPHPDA